VEVKWWHSRSLGAKLALLTAAVVMAVAVVGSQLQAGGADAAEAPSPARFVVSEVIDGDTIRLANGTRVRLLQINAPELRPVAQCHADLSRLYLARLIDRPVRLEPDPALDRIDDHGRELAYVFVGRKNVNVAMVRRGAAHVFFDRGERGRYAKRLARAEREARAAGRGLWRACWQTAVEPVR
jgi:micrococcal nuclease